jgi:hypothetical protein
MADTQQRLSQRLKAEPGVRAVAVADTLPRMDHQNSRIEVEGADTQFSKARRARVDRDYFAELGQPILSGRAFEASDLGGGAHAVIVNTTFVTHVLDGANPIGRRLRFLSWDDTTAPSPWHAIVGVVGHLGMHSNTPDQDEGIYELLTPGSIPSVRFAVELSGHPSEFTPRLREIARDVDAQAVILSPRPLDQVFEGDWYVMALAVLGGVLLVGVLLTLAASGIYAIMSFTVAQRTREIGIRVALGADRLQIAWQVARRALTQIGIGALIGMLFAGRIFYEIQAGSGNDGSVMIAILLALLPGIAIMVLVGLAACAAPTLRALRVSPVEALRGDG